jgi:hypothetical protein
MSIQPVCIDDFFWTQNQQKATKCSENKILCGNFSFFYKKKTPNLGDTNLCFLSRVSPHLCLQATVLKVPSNNVVS